MSIYFGFCSSALAPAQAISVSEEQMLLSLFPVRFDYRIFLNLDATLSLSGQLIDEIGIVWAVLFGCTISIPRRSYPNCVFKGSRARIRSFLLLVSALGTALMFLWPKFNAIILIISATPILTALFYQTKRTTDWGAVRLGFATFVWCETYSYSSCHLPN